jgi:hypothetical protein
MNDERPYRYRYQYVRLENSADSTNPDTSESSARLIHLNFYAYPAELPYIDGYRFNMHMNLEAWDQLAKSSPSTVIEPLLNLLDGSSVGHENQCGPIEEN